MSKASIKEKINRLKKNVINLKAEKNSYQSAYTQAQNLVIALKSTKNSLITTASSLENCYTKAGKIAKHEDISSIKDNIDNLLNQLNTIVLVNINTNINSLSRTIDRKNEEISRLWDEYYVSED